MLKRFVRLLGGDPNKKIIEKYAETVDQINALEAQFEALDHAALKGKTAEFRQRLAQGETLDELLPEAFAAVREASKRHLGLRHYDVQLIGGIALHQGHIAEMRTGEGKTLVATLPLYLNALAGRGCHLVTVNDYLARRDARWMAPIYNALGLSVGVLQMAARTENGKKAFLVDLERESPHEDQHQLRMVPRQEAYAADITYGTNSEFGFDYLRDNMTYRLDDRVQRGHYYAIVDEVDNVLIDEARTPLIISGPAQDDTEWYVRMAQVVKRLQPEDYEINEHDRTITLTEIGEAHVEELLEIPLRDPDRPEDVTPEQARLMGYLEQALRAQFLFKRNKDYLVQGGKVIIIDEFTGRLMPGRRWSDGLHQAVEAKEGVRVQAENITYATITIQNYFRMYEKLAGMTGTAVTEAEEFHKIYKLEVVAIPTNLEYRAALPDSDLVELEGRDESGYKFRYYARRDGDQPAGQPIFWKRKDYPDAIYRTEEAKFRAITREIMRYYAQGRPMLVGTTSVELSERLAARLRAEPLRRLAQVMLVRDAWMEKHDIPIDGRQIPELQPLMAPLDQISLNELRKLANEAGLSFNPEDAHNLDRLATILEINPHGYERERLLSSLKAGIPLQVLNARKHTEESQIIAGAGAFGAVTIATNMAGRGVDIKLGGELPEDILTFINRLLREAGVADPYSITNAERLDLLKTYLLEEFELIPRGLVEKSTLAPREQIDRLKSLLLEKFGPPAVKDEWATLSNILYNSGKFPLKNAGRIVAFWEHVEKELLVRGLGGLHVIGSERHEARRIDNQLRGRAARQGDPGSSRFYLSMEDELMRRFGGQQANDLMQRLKIDDALPIEMGLVSRLVEQSQTRVEGANFDVRKHLLEYDDVLNAQRKRIYEQRDRIFVKDDLSEDVTEMLRTEVKRRVPEALKDEEGPWKLLAWLEGVQPPLAIDHQVFPSYTYKLLLDQLSGDPQAQQNPRQALLQVAENALKAEEEHLLKTLDSLLAHARQRMEGMLRERLEALDTFLEGLNLAEEEEGVGNRPRSPRELVDELSGLLHMPVRLTPEQQRALRSPSDRRMVEELAGELRAQVETAVTSQSAARVIGAMERRLEEPLDLNPAQMVLEDWDELAERLLEAVQDLLDKRRQRLIDAESGQITRELESALARYQSPLSPQAWLNLLLAMPQGSRATFDRRTHRRVWQRTSRLTYIYYAGRLIDDLSPEEVTEAVLAHLEQAQAVIRSHWGAVEWERLAAARPADLDEQTQNGLRLALGEEKFTRVAYLPLQDLSPDDIAIVKDELGRRALTEVYRPLLLSVITDLWVDYLTQMEALRVSIGLEAYAQRDPLVQYKTRASELFQELFSNMRLGVVNRMFTFRPRGAAGAQTLRRGKEAAEGQPAALPEEAPAGALSPGNGEPDTARPDRRSAEPPEEEEAAQEGEPEAISSSQAGPAPRHGEAGRMTKSKKRRRSRR